jgi:uncharacterized BrkB/YihY/UPF0761 family membrane protein
MTVDPPPPGEQDDEARGLVGKARFRAEETWARVEDARPRIPALDAAFDVRSWDQEVGGGLLAGALAFRLFLWLVPFAFVAVETFGWLVRDDVLSQEDLAERFGIAGVVARYVGEASQRSTSSRLFVVILGLYALYLASIGAVRALRVANVLAWRMPITRFHGTLRAALWFICVTTLLILSSSMINALRESQPGPSIALLLALAVGVGGVWLLASWRLPHPVGVPLAALVPGSVLFAVGTGAMHFVTVLWYAHKVAHSTELYGALGTAVGLLAWLYLLGRLTIASAVVNATLWRRHAGPREPVHDGSVRPG